ncbi:hypothetical protein ACC699_07335 [Rhizobium ruizarguesonis]
MNFFFEIIAYTIGTHADFPCCETLFDREIASKGIAWKILAGRHRDKNRLGMPTETVASARIWASLAQRVLATLGS